MMPSRLKLPEKNHSVTAQSSQVFLVSDSLQCQHKNITHKLDQKLPPPRNSIFTQMDGKSYHATQCAKSRAWTKVIDLILEIHLF